MAEEDGPIHPYTSRSRTHPFSRSSSSAVYATPATEELPDVADEAGLEEEDEAKRLAKTGDRRDALIELAALHSLLIFAAIWGVLTREGLVALGSYAGLSVFPTLLAQVVGCFIMGLANQQKGNITAFYGSLFPGIATGFCGSVTTFSTWMLQVFEAFANTAGFRRHGLHNAVDGISQTVATMGMSAASITFGFQCGALCENAIRRPSSSTTLTDKSPAPPRTKTWVADYSLAPHLFVISLGPASWLGSALLLGLGPHSWRGSVTWSLIFGPVGTLLRFHLARLNAWPASEKNGFPLGTFTANISGTAVNALLAMLQISGAASGSVNGCGVLQGLRDGFCGCLTTVSTFAFELRNLRPERAWRYAIVSWVVGQVMCVLLFGAYSWSRGSQGMCAL